MLWLNLITDGAPALALAVEKGDPDIMQQKPRAKSEPIVNRSMMLGPGIQTIAQTAAVLTAFALGLIWHLEAGAHVIGNPVTYLLQHDWRGVDVQTAETMAFVTLSLCELFRAYTVRSERASIFTDRRVLEPLYAVCGGPFDWAADPGVCRAVPAADLQYTFPQPEEWAIVVGLALIPATAEEITKFFLRRSKPAINIVTTTPEGFS